MKFLIFSLLTSFTLAAQTEYPQDYFTAPLDIPLVLSGTFAELRSSHFHSGLDIKTQQKQGLKVYAAAEGYVSRIKISHYGYGKALYITHPNGYTTVYAHLQKFSNRLETYIKNCQYDKESFEIEVFPNSQELPIQPHEIIAYSGNTGDSGGPHLHFEIRDNAERPINPMLFGLNIKDTTAPYVTGVFAYPISKNAHINGKSERVRLRLIPKKDNIYEVEKIAAYGTIGFGVVTNDKQDLAPNNNGVSHITSYFNGNKCLEIDFKRFSFNESKHIKRFVDYDYQKNEKINIQKLFIQKNNPLSLFKNVDNEGYIEVEDSTASVYKVRILDFNKNEAWVHIPVKGNYDPTLINTPTDQSNKTIIYNGEATELKAGKITVNFNKNTVYEDSFINFEVNSDTLHLHEDKIPLQKNYYINYDISNYNKADKNKLFIAQLYGKYKTPYYIYTKRKGNILTAGAKTFGTFALTLDTESPKITPTNFTDKKWISKYRYLELKITDNLSGISKYRATINGKWILMEYDYKTNSLTYDFNDKAVIAIKNEFKLIVTDNVGNSSTFEATFFRK